MSVQLRRKRRAVYRPISIRVGPTVRSNETVGVRDASLQLRVGSEAEANGSFTMLLSSMHLAGERNPRFECRSRTGLSLKGDGLPNRAGRLKPVIERHRRALTLSPSSMDRVGDRVRRSNYFRAKTLATNSPVEVLYVPSNRPFAVFSHFSFSDSVW